MHMSGDNKPIGWWIKEVDRLLELAFERVLAADGVSRRQWQALNAARGEEPIEVALAPFLAGDPAELAAVTEKVQAERRRITNGIVDSEYLQTIDVLRRMAVNLGYQPTNGSAV
ncbi:hypothetical protein EV644_103239 [Kribbella orskensis]|uniref:MerR-like DNA binding protein n=1 Tax=Kribbella orskensis TaxID=2512216 RepID=A0ABY2BPX0_9ACTN|nr:MULTISPECIES: hypothetical protein [Kribbella]TCN39677.1 hypothetical protein EV642_106181 [Kribbella sp. VKM Ac-2500]TCO27540.1 hypothetical protein EV644_103239 [Kribbella orskensis]